LVILGIDPGLSTCGYGIIEISDNFLQCHKFGCIHTKKNPDTSDRLKKIFDDLTEVIQIYNPHICAIEDIFYHENVNTAIIMGHARGVAMLAAKQAEIEIFEYAPREIKMSITGNGAASKQQIQSMVQNLLSLEKPPTPYDASDALAVALCHYHRHKFNLLKTAVK
jgi:crossover junction endodeoxyribonuclease RuvC